MSLIGLQPYKRTIVGAVHTMYRSCMARLSNYLLWSVLFTWIQTVQFITFRDVNKGYISPVKTFGDKYRVKVVNPERKSEFVMDKLSDSNRFKFMDEVKHSLIDYL